MSVREERNVVRDERNETAVDLIDHSLPWELTEPGFLPPSSPYILPIPL